MRIGVDLSAIQSTKSGVDWYTHNVIREIISQLGPDEHLFLFSNRETGFEKDAAGNRQVTLLRSRARYQEPWRQLVLPGLLKKYRIDVCFFTNFVTAAAAPCPTVLTIHDLSFRLFPRTHSLRNILWTRSLVPVSVRRSSHIIAVSNNTRLDLIRLMSVDEDKVSVVYEGVSDDFHPEAEAGDADALDYYGISAPYILSVGTLEPRKNLNQLIRAFESVAAAVPDITLVLAGRRGWMAQAIFDELERHDLLDRVRITGYVQERHLPALYRHAALFVYPSLYEGFGLPPLEAMASGTPVIVSHSSSLPEVVGDAGLYADPLNVEDLAAAMQTVLADEKLAADLAARGLKRAGEFSWKQAAARTLEIIRSAARGG